MSEKRAHARQLMREDAVLANPGGDLRQPVVLLDISRVGICFTSPAKLDGGSRHMLNFKLPGVPLLHETVVEVVHSSESGVPAGYRVGARFIHIQLDTTEAIAQFVSASVSA